MIWLRFQYKQCKKGYYVDGHEKPATVSYKNSFCQCYLSYEQRMYHWVQVLAAEAKELEERVRYQKAAATNT